MAKWTVTIEHQDTEEPVRVQYTTSYDPAEHKCDSYGYPCDEALGFAIGMALRGVATCDDQPWLLASLMNIMHYLDLYTDEHRIVGLAAQVVWAAFRENDHLDSTVEVLSEQLSRINDDQAAPRKEAGNG